MPKKTTDKLQRVLIAAARIVSITRKYDRGLRQFRQHELHWVGHHRPCSVQSVCPGVQVSTHHGTWIPVGTLPTCIQRSWSLSPAGRGELNFPHVNLSTYGGRAFAYACPTSWNSLPDNLRNVNLSLQTFKRHLMTFFFSSY